MTLPFNDSVDIQKFFDSEKEWKNRLGYSWTGTKFLGKGAAGVTALWEYRGLEEYKPPLTQVVVKMSQEVYDGLQDPNVKPKDKYFEGEILERLSGARNGHIVRIFGGNRLGDRFGELGDTIKILLEFCPGGNLDRFLPQSMPEQAEVGETGLEEADLWTIFYCLATGVTVIAQVMEETTGYGIGSIGVRRRELMHCDLKPDNIFFGYKDKDHSRLPIAKLADFGDAVLVRDMKRQDDEYGGITWNRGMDWYRAPEEMYEWKWSPWDRTKYPLLHPRKGNCTNIWQIGAIMNCIITRRRLNFNPGRNFEKYYPSPRGTSSRPKCAEVLKREFNHSQYLEPNFEQRDCAKEGGKKEKEKGGGFFSFGGKKRKREEKEGEDLVIIAGKTYSNTLIDLIQECLLRESLSRPSHSELLKRTKLGFEGAKRLCEEVKIKLPPLPFALGQIPIKEPYSEEAPPGFDVSDTVPGRRPRAKAAYEETVAVASKASSGFRKVVSVVSTITSMTMLLRGEGTSVVSGSGTSKTPAPSRSGSSGRLSSLQESDSENDDFSIPKDSVTMPPSPPPNELGGNWETLPPRGFKGVPSVTGSDVLGVVRPRLKVLKR